MNWQSAGDSFTWDIKVVNDGDYEIFLQYMVPPGSEGAKIEISANGKSLVKEIEEPFVPEAYPNRDQVDRGRPPEMKWKNFSWGSMQLQKGEYRIEVRATEIPGSQVGELHGIRIKQL